MRGFLAGRRRGHRGFDSGEGGLEPEDGVLEGTACGASLRVHRPTSPSIGLLAVAYIFRGMRPARYASLPARTASFIDSAIATGSCAPAIAVFISTPSAPSSIANVASDAVPTPASTMTGTRANSRMIRRLFTF